MAQGLRLEPAVSGACGHTTAGRPDPGSVRTLHALIALPTAWLQVSGPAWSSELSPPSVAGTGCRWLTTALR